MIKKPLVLERGEVQQLQGQTDLDIPLADRVDSLENQMTALTTFLAAQGFEIPEELAELL